MRLRFRIPGIVHQAGPDRTSKASVPIPTRRLAGPLAVLTLFVSMLAAGSAAAGERVPSFFGSTETLQTQLRPMARNAAAIDRALLVIRGVNRWCFQGNADECPEVEWKGFLHQLSEPDQLKVLQAVNDYVNDADFEYDSDNYDKGDYWASPAEFFRRGGDCEDYALTKYASLRALGFSGDDLRIAVVHDKRRDLMHAVLLATVDDTLYVLDNVDGEVRAADEVERYRVIYSLNERAWWVHRERSG